MKIKNRTFRLLWQQRFIIICVVSLIHSTQPEPSSSIRAVWNEQWYPVFSNPVYINQATTIRQPGTYALNNTLDFNPLEPGRACIIIDSDDVVLDLNKNTLQQASGNTQEQITGILITEGKKNILIRNGTISNMSQNGILVRDGCNQIGFNNLVINATGSKGIFCQGEKRGRGISNITLSNVEVQNLSYENAPLFGMLFKFTSCVTLEQCIANTLKAVNSNCYGFKAKHCSLVEYNACLANNCTSNGLRSIGFNTINSSPSLFSFCVAQNIQCAGEDSSSYCSGYNCERSQNLYYSQCTSVGHNAQFFAAGFRILQCSNSQIKHSKSTSHTSSSFDSCGYYAAQCTALEFLKCSAESNIGNNNGYGFYSTDNCEQLSFDHCKARFNSGINRTSYGFFSEKTFHSSYFYNSIVGTGNDRESYGIFDTSEAATNNLILSNKAQHNRRNYIPADPTIPIFSGPLSATPSPFENISL